MATTEASRATTEIEKPIVRTNSTTGWIWKYATSGPRTGQTKAIPTTIHQRRESSRPSGKISNISVTASGGATRTQASPDKKFWRAVIVPYAGCQLTRTVMKLRARHSQPTPFLERSETMIAPTVA
jgi:hypothetical protein